MLTKQQSDELLKRFKVHAWNLDKRELEAADVPYELLVRIIQDYTLPPDEDLDCPDLPSHYYLQGVRDAVVTTKAAIGDEAAELISIEMTAEEFRAAIEETIDVNIDYMLSGD